VAQPRPRSTVGPSVECFGSGQSGFGCLGDAVQLDVELGVRAGPELIHLGLEFGHFAPQPGHLEKECLLIADAYISEQGACHVATLRFTWMPAPPRTVTRGRVGKVCILWTRREALE